MRDQYDKHKDLWIYGEHNPSVSLTLIINPMNLLLFDVLKTPHYWKSFTNCVGRHDDSYFDLFLMDQAQLSWALYFVNDLFIYLSEI